MAITVLSASSTQNLTTLDTLKVELGISISDMEDDEVLEKMITRASELIAVECGRVFGAERVAETLRGAKSRLLRLSRAPIIEVESLLEDSVPITDWVLEDAELGALYRDAGWGYSYLGGWDSSAWASGYILPGTSAYRYIATYTGGYLLPSQTAGDPVAPPLPGPIEQAALETVKSWYNSREGGSDDLSAVRVGNLSITYQSTRRQETHALSPQVAGMLRHYKLILP